METSLENLYMYMAARQKLTAKAYSVSKDLPSSLIDIRNFKIQRRERQREGQKNNWFNKQNNITLFCTFLSCFCTSTIEMPNFAFYGGRKQATTKFYFSF